MKRFALPIIIVVAVAALIAVFAIGNKSSSSPSSSATPAAKAISDPTGLPGLLTSPSPWPANTSQLAARLDAIGLPKLPAEGTVMHIHQHLDIYVNGQQVPVPAQLGIYGPAQMGAASNNGFFSTIHTHDTTGIVHVESTTVQSFYLGQVFDVWGVKLTQDCLGSYCSGNGNSLTVYVNGQKYTGDPRQLKLDAHQEIAVVYGQSGQTPSPLPSSYAFPSGT